MPISEPDAETVEAAARACGVCRSIIFRALAADPVKRKGLPFLPSMKIGAARRIRPAARRQWLADLEAATVAAEAEQAA